MKHCIPLQRFETVEIELKSYNLETHYFNFEINIFGVTDTKIRLTGETIDLIHKETKKMIAKVSKHKKASK